MIGIMEEFFAAQQHPEPAAMVAGAYISRNITFQSVEVINSLDRFEIAEEVLRRLLKRADYNGGIDGKEKEFLPLLAFYIDEVIPRAYIKKKHGLTKKRAVEIDDAPYMHGINRQFGGDYRNAQRAAGVPVKNYCEWRK